jgi:hypothetical protein
MLGHLRSGPSGPYLDGFAAALERQGYSPATAVRLFARGSSSRPCHGGARHRLEAHRSGGVRRAFANLSLSARQGSRRNHHTVFGARLFRQHLVEIGVCRPAVAATQPAEPQLVARLWMVVRIRAKMAQRKKLA